MAYRARTIRGSGTRRPACRPFRMTGLFPGGPYHPRFTRFDNSLAAPRSRPTRCRSTATGARRGAAMVVVDVERWTGPRVREWSAGNRRTGSADLVIYFAIASAILELRADLAFCWIRVFDPADQVSAATR